MSDRLPARWMCTLDERILEYVDESILATPSRMESEIRFHASEGRIRERCEMLRQAGLIAPVTDHGDLYLITMQGIGYLNGDLDARHQPTPSIDYAGA